MPFLEPLTQERLAAAELAKVLDYLVTSMHFFSTEEGNDVVEPIRHLVFAASDPRALAKLLKHPGCNDDPREWMLMRFEELLFHEGKHVFLTLPESEAESPAGDPGGLKPNRSPVKPPARRFHTIHDAAAWIEKNWPDFDLESTPEVQWRVRK